MKEVARATRKDKADEIDTVAWREKTPEKKLSTLQVFRKRKSN
jgi:hypothetical protein